MRVGLVRRVVMTPTGGILESCGEALASVSCITAAARPSYASSLTLRRRGTRYSGRLSSGPGCNGNRRVGLRRLGSGNQRYGTTYTQPDGRFTIQRSRRLRGAVYVVAAQQPLGMAICRSGNSRAIRG